MKKFWIIFVSFLLCAVIGVGIWHGIAYGDKIKVFAEETWQKIESVFKKDNDEHVHEFFEWSEVLAATCTEPGQERRTCVCGEYEEREIDALGHTCRVGICERCGIHLYHDSYCGLTKKVSSSCQESGHVTGICDGCGEAYDVEIVPFGHEKFLSLYMDEDYIFESDTIRCSSTSARDTRVAQINAGLYLRGGSVNDDCPNIVAIPVGEMDFKIVCGTCGLDITSICFLPNKVVNPYSVKIDTVIS